MIRVAINGFGRIGRLAFREIITGTDFDVVAINDLTDAEELSYLLKYDTVHRSFHEDLISYENDELVINKIKRVKVFKSSDPSTLPWRDLNVDVVLECTGHFTDYDGAYKHIIAGAKKVLISAPSKTDSVKTIVYGVNDNIITKDDIILSSASCTTNCLAPILKVINDNIGIEKGFMTTIHAYTNDQTTLDISHKKGIKSRRGRAASMNIIPTSTGAASAIGKVIPDLLGKMDGYSYRVPVSDGSMLELTLELKRNTSITEINNLYINNQNDIIKITNDPIVSSDILGKKIGALVDAALTNVIEVNGKQLVKIVAWYDNEMGYTHQMMETLKAMFKIEA